MSAGPSVLRWTLLAAAPAALAAPLALRASGAPPLHVALCTAALVAFALWAAARARGAAEGPLRVAATVASGLREGDTSVRARLRGGDGPDDELFGELNALADTLREQRLAAAEAAALARKITAAVPSALFAFDEAGRIVLANAAAERLLGRPLDALRGQLASDLGLADLLSPGGPRRHDGALAGKPGPWEVSLLELRQGGLPVRLLVVTDIARVVEDEERHAQRALVRVLGHEINNSLGPIHSLADSLLVLVRSQPSPDPDLDEGLAVIARRASSLRRFLDAYGKLTRLPPPNPSPCDLRSLVERAIRLEGRPSVRLAPGDPLVAHVDEAQIEQAVVNLLRNAVEACDETGGSASVCLERRGDLALLTIDDEGPGLASTESLFVPFFTTKPGGSGIGLCLSREIARAHGGSLDLRNRPDARGCRAELALSVGAW